MVKNPSVTHSTPFICKKRVLFFEGFNKKEREKIDGNEANHGDSSGR